VREECPGSRRDDCDFVVRACEGADCVERVEPQDGHEFQLTAVLPPKQVDAPEAVNPAGPDAFENLCAQKHVIRIRILRRRPALPYATDPAGILLSSQSTNLGAHVVAWASRAPGRHGAASAGRRLDKRPLRNCSTLRLEGLRLG